MEESSQEKIIDVDFSNAISERYISYALSTIMSRSLPDVRDGLKPVHRRLLYAMMKLNLDPSSKYKKCARVVGDVIGKYHPHGDTAVYDTLVRLAQNFSLRYPLIDGQGNFGSVDGDNAAAMRYTESRLTDICMYLMQDLDNKTVDFRPTYDDSDIEPALFPAMFPNLLANGTEGIAVGMATSVPPHNLSELCDVIDYLAGKRIDGVEEVSVSELMRFVKGPDFPTGGTIIDSNEAILNAYETGRGSFRVRSKWEINNLSHGQYQITISEIPYQVSKSKLIEQIANLLKDKKLPLISNIRDESDEQIRIIIEPRSKNCDAKMLMESLFKQTTLESKAQLNLNILGSNGAPQVMSLAKVMQEFINFRQEVIIKRSNYRISKIEERIETLEALKIAFLNIDEVIRIIRFEDDPKAELIKVFNINSNQAEAILNIKLRSLRKLEEDQINKEHDRLQMELRDLQALLSNKKKLWREVQKESKIIKKKYGEDTEIGKRRTDFKHQEFSSNVVDIGAFIEREPLTIICSKLGWIRSIRNHNIDLDNLKFKDGDKEAFIIETYTTDNILIFSRMGRCFTILADNLAKGRGNGESIRLIIDLDSNDDIVQISPHKLGQKLLLATRNGKGFIVCSDALIASTKSGKQVMNVTKGDECIICKSIAVDDDIIACIGSNRKLLIFRLEEIPEMRRGQGVQLQKYRDAKLCDIKTFKEEEGLSWKLGSKIRRESDILEWRARRGSVGKIPPVGFPKDNKFE